MALNSMYENLMGLPLFNGVSYNRISGEIKAAPALHSLKFLPGEERAAVMAIPHQTDAVIGGNRLPSATARSVHYCARDSRK